MSNALFETGDRVTEDALAEYMRHQVLADYLQSGGGITTDFANDQITVAAGSAYLTYQSGLYYVEPDQTTLTLPAPSGTNLVFVAYDPSTDDAATYEIDTAPGNVADPKIQIATVDGGGQTVTLENQLPDVDLATVAIDALTLAGAMDAGGFDITNIGEAVATLVDAVTVEGETVNAQTTLTDPSGTNHTGALADLTGPGGVLVSSQLPQLSITSVNVVADQTARLALSAEEGDFAIQQDNSTSYILSTNDPTQDSNWVEVDFDAVAAIAGQPIAPASVSASGAVSGSDLTASGTSEAATYTVDGNTLAQSVVASGQVALTSGTATVDTGISAVDATFQLALGVDDPNADTKVAGNLFWDDTAGTYKIEINEDSSTSANPTVNYDVVRVR